MVLKTATLEISESTRDWLTQQLYLDEPFKVKIVLKQESAKVL